MSHRVISFSFLVFAFSVGGCSKSAAPPAEQAPAGQKQVVPVAGAPAKIAVGQKAHCPVTGEEFVVAASTVQVEHEGKHFAFCCAECQPAFDKDPAKFAKKN